MIFTIEAIAAEPLVVNIACNEDNAFHHGKCLIRISFNCSQSGNRRNVVSISNACRQQDVDAIFGSMSEEYLTHLEEENFEDQELWTTERTPEIWTEEGGKSRAGVILPTGTGHSGNGNFRRTFGRSYDQSLSGKTLYMSIGNQSGTQWGSGMFLEEHAGLTAAGATLYYAYQADDIQATGEYLVNTLSDMGNRMVVGWKMILYGGNGDQLARTHRENLRKATDYMLESVRTSLVKAAGRIDTAEKVVVTLTEITRIDTTNILKSTRAVIKESIAHLKETKNQFRQATTQLTSAAKVKISELQLPDEEIQQLREGRLGQNYITEKEAELTATIDGDQPALALDEINQLYQMSLTDSNPFRREELDNLIKNFVDDRGLISRWAANDRVAQSLQLKTDPTGTYGKRIRQNINHALSLKHQSEDVYLRGRADAVMLLNQQADNAFSNQEQRLGKRRWKRGQVLLDYMSDHPRLARHRQATTTEAAQNQFGITTNGNTFEGYEVTKLANALAQNEQAVGPNANPNVHFQSVLSVKQADSSRQNGNVIGLINAVETGWSVLDYAQGFAIGVKYAVVDTITGIQHLVTHPIDSAEAIINAIVNYDKTIDFIAQKFNEFIDEYPGLSLMEKAILHGRIAAGLGEMFIGVGAIKNASHLVRFSQKISVATGRLMTKVVPGVQGVRRLAASAPNLLGSLRRFHPKNIQLGQYLRRVPAEYIQKLSRAVEPAVIKARTLLKARRYYGQLDFQVSSISRRLIDQGLDPSRLQRLLKPVYMNNKKGAIALVDMAEILGSPVIFGLETANIHVLRKLGQSTHKFLNSYTARAMDQFGVERVIIGKQFLEETPSLVRHYMETATQYYQKLKNGEPLEIYTVIKRGAGDRYLNEALAHGMKGPNFRKHMLDHGQGWRLGPGRYSAVDNPNTALWEVNPLTGIIDPTTHAMVKAKFFPTNGLDSSFHLFPSVRKPGQINIVDRDLSNRLNFTSVEEIPMPLP